MKSRVDEVAPDLFRISTFHPDYGMQFNQFLLRDDEPVLIHTGMKAMMPTTLEAVAKVVDPSTLRWVGFSHFESDECGSLNEWLAAAPRADVVCGAVGALVSVNDFIGREARALADGDTFSTGKYRFRYCRTPHLPHGWDAGVLFEETQRTLLCSDLFHQSGDVEPVTSADVVGRSHKAMKEYQAGVLADYVPYTPLTGRNLEKLAKLGPRTLAIMHGSSFTGDCTKAFEDLHRAYREVFGREP